MGRPKALVPVDGTTMAARVAGALREAGIERILLVGGDPAWAVDVGADAVADRWPGEGPLAGTATALAAAAGLGGDPLVVVAACDQPWLTGPALAAIVAGLRSDPHAMVAVARTADGRRHPFPSAWRPGSAGLLAELVEAGDRRADAAFGRLAVVDVATDGRLVADVDRPEDLR